jgi:Right handed beta helix region
MAQSPGMDASGFGSRSRFRAALVAATFVLAALWAGPAAAATVYVDCSGGTPGAFTSIGAAVNSLAAPPPTNDWHYILLKSNCTENVLITGGRKLWIAPDGSQCPYAACLPTGPALRITAAAANQDVVQVAGPGDVTFVHLLLSGGSNGLNASGNAVVTTFDVIAEDNASAGFIVGSGAALFMNEGGSRRNGWFGVSVGEGATASLNGHLPWLGNQTLVVTGNKGGVRADRGVLLAATGVTVEGNTGPGIQTFGGKLSWGAYQGETVVQNNQGGAFLSEGSQASLWRSGTGTSVFRNNGTYGVYVEKNSHATIFDILIEGHSGMGVDTVMGSQVALHGTRVRANGSSTAGTGGVRIDGNSNAFVEEAQVTDNLGPAFVVDLNSSVDARAPVVTGNAREAFRLRAGSFLNLTPGGSLGPNTGPPVTCDLSSHVVSSTLSRSFACFNVAPPTQPRPVRPPT